jgi:glucosamine--fructose-6-phosphate aminotransferase (isomerizing)
MIGCVNGNITSNYYYFLINQVRRSDIPKHHGALLAISQSGETKDVYRAVRTGEEMGVPCISVVNSVGSLIARTTGLGVYINAGRFVCIN